MAKRSGYSQDKAVLGTYESLQWISCSENQRTKEIMERAIGIAKCVELRDVRHVSRRPVISSRKYRTARD
jgi:hypothetical protein